MPLKSRKRVPPFGWLFREPSTGWTMPESARLMPFSIAVQTIVQYRINNARLGLNIDYNVAAKDLEAFTCQRLPELCTQNPDVIRAQLARDAAKVRLLTNCPGCGRRQKAR
jgi:hypothetical protein